MMGQDIDDTVVRKLLDPFVKELEDQCASCDGALQRIAFTYKDFVPTAMKRVRANTHMHNADGSNCVNENNADALLVGYINSACLPADLALYAEDLLPKTNGCNAK